MLEPQRRLRRLVGAIWVRFVGCKLLRMLDFVCAPQTGKKGGRIFFRHNEFMHKIHRRSVFEWSAIEGGDKLLQFVSTVEYWSVRYFGVMTYVLAVLALAIRCG